MTQNRTKEIPGNDTKTIDPFNVILVNWKQIILFGGIIFLLLSPIAYLYQTPYYEVSGQVRISPVIPALLRPMEDLSITGYYHDHLRTELEKIQQPEIMNKLEERISKIGSTLPVYWPENRNDKFLWYKRHIEVKQVPRTQLLEIKMQQVNPDHMEGFVNELILTYLDMSRDDEEKKDTRRLKYLLEVKDEVSLKRKQLQEKLKTLAREMGTGTFEQGYWIKKEMMSESHKSLTRAMTENIKSNSWSERIYKENELLKGINIEGKVEDRLSYDDSLWNTEFWTYQYLQKMRSTIDGITLDNPDRKYIDLRIENAKEYLDAFVYESTQEAEDIENKLRDIRLQEREIEAEQRLLESERVITQLKGQNHLLEKELRESAGNLVIARSWRKELEHQLEMEFRLNERIHELKLDAKAPDRVSLSKKAHKPEHPSGSDLKKRLILSTVFSFGIVSLFLFISAYRDGIIRNPLHIEMATGIYPSWPISSYNDYKMFNQIVLRSSSHQSARALRSLGFRLLREHKKKDILSVCFTGVSNRTGVSSIAINISQTLRATGLRVLMIEVNSLNPSLDDFMLKENKEDILKIDDLEIYKDTTRKIDFIKTPLDNVKTCDVITNELSGEYDILIYDCAPLLQSDITEAIAGKTDVTVLVSKGGQSSYIHLRRSFSILWRMGIKNIIPVLNWGKPKNSTHS